MDQHHDVAKSGWAWTKQMLGSCKSVKKHVRCAASIRFCRAPTANQSPIMTIAAHGARWRLTMYIAIISWTAMSTHRFTTILAAPGRAKSRTCHREPDSSQIDRLSGTTAATHKAETLRRPPHDTTNDSTHDKRQHEKCLKPGSASFSREHRCTSTGHTCFGTDLGYGIPTLKF